MPAHCRARTEQVPTQLRRANTRMQIQMRMQMQMQMQMQGQK